MVVWEASCVLTAEKSLCSSLVAGSFEVARSSVFSLPELRSELAQPGAGVPPDMLVVISGEGKTFHAAGCPFIHDKAHTHNPGQGSAATGICPLRPLHEKYLTS